jgi:TonB-dependent Receptor Plug Domain
MILKKQFFVWILFVFSNIGFTQQKTDLKIILNTIENQHNIKFNYIDDMIFNLTVIAPKSLLSLNEKLQNLESQTNLIFEIIDSKYITIRVNSPIEKQEITSLETVVIPKYLTSGIAIKLDGTLEIKPKKFGILPGLIAPDVLQTMQQIPGIYSTDETISNINVRGGTQDQNLFLWNGIRMFQTGHFFGMISAFNPLLAQNITIVKNGSSAFFGESVSSLVDIKTNSYQKEKNKTSISSNLISTEFCSKFNFSEKSSLEISGRRSITDFFISPTYKNYRDKIFQNTIVTDFNNKNEINFINKEKFYFYDFTAQYIQKIGSKNEFSVSGIAIKNNLIIDQTSQNSVKFNELNQENIGANMNWKTNWNVNNSSELNFSSSYYNLEGKNQSITNNINLNQQNIVLNFGIQVKNSIRVSNQFLINSGYQFNEIGVTNFDEINIPNFKRKIKDVLISHILIAETVFESINKKAFLKTGIRVNYFQKFEKFIFEPRIQFHYNLSDKFSLEVLGEQKSQTISQIIDLQQDFLGIEKRRWTLANDSINPIQKSKQASIGLTFKNKDWLLTIDNFYKKITGISVSSQGFQNQYEFVKSTGNYEIIGSEILIQRNFKDFYSWISYSLNNNNYEFSKLNDNIFPNNFELTHNISFAGIYEFNKIKLALGGKWHSGKPITAILNEVSANLSNKIIFDKPNKNNLPDYFQMNFSASKKWNFKKNLKLETCLSIMNLLNTKNIINQFYRYNTINNSIENVETNSLRITPNLSFNLEF